MSRRQHEGTVRMVDPVEIDGCLVADEYAVVCSCGWNGERPYSTAFDAGNCWRRHIERDGT